MKKQDKYKKLYKRLEKKREMILEKIHLEM